MNLVAFRRQIDKLISTFSAKPFEGHRMVQIEEIARELTEAEFEKIVNHFVSSSRQAPLPVDFRDAARRERAARGIRSHGPRPEYIPRCTECEDVGVVAMLEPGASAWVLGLCHCDQGKLQPWKLPIARDVPGYRTMALPWEPFKPDIPIVRNPRDERELKVVEIKVGRAIQAKVEWWRERVRIAEQYWLEHGTEFDGPEAS